MKKLLKERPLLVIILFFTLLRLAAIALMGLTPQDAYYSYYSENLSLSYFDHPPMVAYMVWFFAQIFGRSLFALHATNFVVTALTLVVLYFFLKKILSGDNLKIAFILIIPTPLITVLSVNTTPDVPLLFFWSVTLLLAYNAVKSGNWYWWLLAGVSSGLAFDSKYTGIFLPAGLFLFLLISKQHRSKIISPGFFMYAGGFALAILPVLIWNIQNNFISFKYQSAERAAGLSGFSFDPLLFPGFLGSQMVLALPLLFFVSYIVGGKLIKKYFKNEQVSSDLLFAASFALPMLFSFTAISFIYWVKINWIMPVFLSALIMVAPYIKSGKALKIQTLFSVVIHLALLVQLIWMPVEIKSDDTWIGWRELTDKIEEIKEENPDDFIFSDNSYKITAAVNFYLDEHMYAGNIIDRFAYQFALDDQDLSHLEGLDAYYVTSSRYRKKRLREGPVEQLLAPYFSSVKLADSLEIRDRDGDTQRVFYFYDCDNYSAPDKN